MQWDGLWPLSQMAQLEERATPWDGLWPLSQMAQLEERGMPWDGQGK